MPLGVNHVCRALYHLLFRAEDDDKQKTHMKQSKQPKVNTLQYEPMSYLSLPPSEQQARGINKSQEKVTRLTFQRSFQLHRENS
jgi:hypothetical protein